MTDPFIPYGRQTIEDDDIASVVGVLKSDYLTTGPMVKQFEADVAASVGANEGVAVSSGTAALHAALWAAGIGPGDEVLVPTLSFLATANAACYVGAKPIFVDSVPNGFNFDIADAERKINSKTKAIIPVHFAGEPVDIDAVRTLAKRKNLIVIEDAAHALGAVYKGKKIGSLSDMTIFSFHPVKHITTGEGGMIMTNDPALARRLRQFRHHGIDVDVATRDARQQWCYDMTELGYNYRITDLQCALGISQLKKLERFLRRREEITAAYDARFETEAALQRPPRPVSPSRHGWHLYIVRLKLDGLSIDRDEIFRRLRAAGIGAHVHYRPIHLHSFYRNLGWKPGDCPQIEKTFPTMLSLPIWPGMIAGMVERVADTLLKIVQETNAAVRTS